MQFEVTYRYRSTNWLASKRFWARNEMQAMVAFWSYVRNDLDGEEVDIVRVEEKFELPVA